jgi:hypothetical protein
LIEKARIVGLSGFLFFEFMAHWERMFEMTDRMDEMTELDWTENVLY